MSARFKALPVVEVALVSATLKTVLQLRAGANLRAEIFRVGIGFDGISSTDPPALVQLYRQTSDGTFSISGLAAKFDPDQAGTLAATAFANATVEPTLGELIDAWEVHPQTGIDVFYPLGWEVVVPAAGRVGIVVTAGANVNCYPKFWAIE